MTHNFDFFRTLESRFVNYNNCFMATKSSTGITLGKASGIRNIFVHNDSKKSFFEDSKKKLRRFHSCAISWSTPVERRTRNSSS